MRNFLFLLSSCLILINCTDQYEDIPDVNVDVYINTLDPKYQNLAGLGAWAYTSGGSKGIIVFQYDLGKFAAYDRHCTYDAKNACSQISADANNIYATDSCCGSKFQLLDGVPIEGPASLPLKKYNTSFDGNIIHIWN
jgi:nitrite reductase/ring-hydroxylating ferredoxin subunit